MPAGQARRYVAMMQFSAAAMIYVTSPNHWPGYVAWLEQNDPGLPAEAAAEPVRQLMAQDAAYMALMAQAGEEMIKE